MADRGRRGGGPDRGAGLLRGEDLSERYLFWRVRGNRELRRGRWEYYRDADGRDQLYDLVADAREQADLAAGRPALLAGPRSAWERNDGALLLPCPAA
ncbi:hypothetical protein ACFUCQ_16120 [Streptomyces sp. NPDC057197]|uniref:hypothetical protein n=1 Tax=Streptomyces sp. NPDC057197 TaxID=3346045 RepID=UPI00363D4434